eukprot:4602844-Amphidinium_carterae.1
MASRDSRARDERDALQSVKAACTEARCTEPNALPIPLGKCLFTLIGTCLSVAQDNKVNFNKVESTDPSSEKHRWTGASTTTT